MAKNKILIFSLAYYPKFVGGAEVAIKEITDRIAPDDIEFHMVCLRFDSRLLREEQIGNVHIHRIGWSTANPSPRAMQSFEFRIIKLWFQFAAAWHGTRLHRHHSFDAAWSMMAHSSGIPGYLFSKRNTVPLVLTLQEGDPIPHIEKTMLPLWPWFARIFTHATIVQAISTFLGQWARDRGFHGPLQIIPNGVDLSLFDRAPVAPDLQTASDIVQKKGGEVVLITTSRLVHKNGIDIIIDALSRLPKTFRLVVLGTGPDEEELKKRAMENETNDRILWAGYVPHERIPAYFSLSDIFVRPSRSEGMGASFVEAMAARLPLVATRVGGIADFLSDETGYIVPVDDPEALAKTVEHLMTDPNRSQIVERAHTLAVEQYDWDLVAKRMQNEVFSPVLKGGTIES